MSMQLNPAIRDDQRTPKWLFDVLHERFKFTHDATAGPGGSNCMPGLEPLPYSSLDQEWCGKRVWANPPYGIRDLEAFTEKFYRTALYRPGFGMDGLGCMLVPAKADQQWFERAWEWGRFVPVPGRVKFEGYEGQPQFASCLFFFGVSYHDTSCLPRLIREARKERK